MLSWNTRALTSRALAAIRACPPSVSYEVVVVDNASEDGSANDIAATYPEVTLVRSAVNLGYGPGNNLAFRHSSGEYVLLLGSDTEVRPGSLDAMLQCFEQEAPAVGAVTPLIEGPTGHPERANYGFPSLRDGVALYLNQPRFARHVPLDDAFDYSQRQRIAQASGTCLLMQRALVMQIGLFDEAYKILYTDVELCQRIHGAGKKIVFNPDAVIMHIGNQSCVQATGALRAQMYQDILRYFVTHFGWRAVAGLLPVLALRLSMKTRGRHLNALARPYALRRTSGIDFGGTRETVSSVP
jgi:GT2 family glycosyltransferase